MDESNNCHTEWSKSDKNKYHIILLIWGIKKMVKMILLTKHKLSHRYRKQTGILSREWGMGNLGDWDWHICSAAAAAAKSLQSCPTLEAHQAPPSLGFSRQEYWSGLPFPSPMHESEKWKGSCSVVSDFSRPHGLQPTRLLRQWDFPGKGTGVGCHCLLCYI